MSSSCWELWRPVKRLVHYGGEAFGIPSCIPVSRAGGTVQVSFWQVLLTKEMASAWHFQSRQHSSKRRTRLISQALRLVPCAMRQARVTVCTSERQLRPCIDGHLFCPKLSRALETILPQISSKSLNSSSPSPLRPNDQLPSP